MFKRVIGLVLALFLLAIPVIPVAAQDGLPEPERVTIEASDGLALIGNFYAPVPLETDEVDDEEDTGAPAVLFLHQLSSDKESWATRFFDLFPELLDAGYGILAVDMRGHGETGGSRDWPLAEDDHQAWLDWLREQPGIDPARISIIGASIGSNMALRAMANDDVVVTAVALSPGLDYLGVTTEDALASIDDRPVFLVASQRDGGSPDAVRTLMAMADGDVLAHIYPGSGHGTVLMMTESDLVPSILLWLDRHNG